MSDNDYKLTRTSGVPVSDAELTSDLSRVARENNSVTVSIPTYKNLGMYDETTISRRFGSWNKALIAAGLDLSNEVNITDERLFENILNLWQHFGRQPRRRDLASSHSEFSQSPYNSRFGSWTSALQSFVDFANKADITAPIDVAPTLSNRSTGRDPSLRLRYRVLKRDSFSCCQCGASPAKTAEVELHIDHIVPWSKGGQTILNNLQTLCSKCNLGKSDCT